MVFSQRELAGRMLSIEHWALATKHDLDDGLLWLALFLVGVSPCRLALGISVCIGMG